MRRRSLAPLAIVLVSLTACSGQNPYQAAKSEQTAVTTTLPATDTPDTSRTGLADNGFIPEDQNVTDCVGTNERPGCGSKQKGGWRMYLVFAALILGLGVIGWRISIGIRQRDSVMNAVDKAD